MNGKYIVRQPVRDRRGKTVGYEVLHNAGGNENTDVGVKGSYAAADAVYQFLTHGVFPCHPGEVHFMTFPSMLLTRRTPNLFQKDGLVIMADRGVIEAPMPRHMLLRYAAEGYQIGLSGFQFAPPYLELAEQVHFIRVDSRDTPLEEIGRIVQFAHEKGKPCIVAGIGAEAAYRAALDAGADGMSGSYVSEKLTMPAHNAGYLKSSFFRLTTLLLQDDPDLSELERLISTDAALSYNLLRLVNSNFFVRKNHVQNIRQAIVLVGLDRLREWLYLMSAGMEDYEAVPGREEFLRLSFLRALFTQRLCGLASEIPITTADAYLLGMFSTFTIMVDMPMEQILEEIPLPDEMREALLHRAGRSGKLLELALRYAAADWAECPVLAGELGIPEGMLAKTYFQCEAEAGAIWDRLTGHDGQSGRKKSP